MKRPRPTARGVVLLATAFVAYLAARLVGTWELYFFAFAFAAAVGVAWLLVLLTVRRLEVERTVSPEQPVAGDPVVLAFRVRNASRLPGLQVTLEDPCGGLGGEAADAGDGLGGTRGRGAPGAAAEGDARLDVQSLGSRAQRTAATRPLPARRGVHRLPPQQVVAEDLMGLVRARGRLGGTLVLTVPPRLVNLSSCDLVGGAGPRRAGRRRRPPTVDASEFRGIRPHNPGEPLNRVDWKATARTGNLMLRELEDASDGGVAVLLNAAAADVAGRGGADAFETAVQVAGSVADCALRTGHPVSLLLADAGWKPLRLSPDAESRRRLPATLAVAAPRGLTQLGPALRTLVAGARKSSRTRSLVLVVLTLDRALARAAAALHEDGLPVTVVHVRAPRPAAAGDEAEVARLLAVSGIPCVPIGPSDDLGHVLGAHTETRRARVR